MTRPRDNAVTGRNDLSRFVVHLTRDDTEDFPTGGQPAADNFRDIMSDHTIFGFRPHCLHHNQIPETHRRKFAVCCFSEVPLTELHLLTRPIPKRRIELSDYGFVFSREALVRRGAQPALYINSYHGNDHAKDADDEIFKLAQKDRFSRGKLRRLVPYMNVMDERHDFAWERQWRMVGDLKFETKDLVCVILPEDVENLLRDSFLEVGVPVISPGWSTERIVAEFSAQAQRARNTLEAGHS